MSIVTHREHASLDAVDLAERLSGLTPFPRITTAPEPDGEWVRLPDLLADRVLDRQLERLGDRTGAPSEVQVTYVTGWLASVLLAPLAAGYRHLGVIPLLDFESVSLRCHEGGWFDAIAIGSPEVLRASDVDGAFGRALTDLVITLHAPLVDHLLPLSRIGRRTIWATITDRLVQRLFPVDPLDAEAERLVGEIERMLGETAAPLDRKRRWTRVELPAGTAVVPVASACCLSYKVPDSGYCTQVCPKRDEETRAEEIRGACAGGG